MLLAAVCQGLCRPWAWGWPYGSSDFTYGKTEDQSTLHQAPRGTHRPEPNTLIPVLGLMSPDKLTFEIVNELHVKWTRWRNWSLGAKIEFKAQCRPSPGRQWGSLCFSLFLCCFPEDYDTTPSVQWCLRKLVEGIAFYPREWRYNFNFRKRFCVFAIFSGFGSGWNERCSVTEKASWSHCRISSKFSPWNLSVIMNFFSI